MASPASPQLLIAHCPVGCGPWHSGLLVAGGHLDCKRLNAPKINRLWHRRIIVRGKLLLHYTSKLQWHVCGVRSSIDAVSARGVAICLIGLLSLRTTLLIRGYYLQTIDILSCQRSLPSRCMIDVLPAICSMKHGRQSWACLRSSSQTGNRAA